MLRSHRLLQHCLTNSKFPLKNQIRPISRNVLQLGRKAYRLLYVLFRLTRCRLNLMILVSAECKRAAAAAGIGSCYRLYDVIFSIHSSIHLNDELH